MSKRFKPIGLVLVLCLLALYTQAQPAIQWTFGAKKIAASTYQLTVKGTLPAPWHVYGLNPGVDGLTPPVIRFDYENVKAVNSPSFKEAPKSIADPIFDQKKVGVYTGDFSISQQIQISGTVPASLKGSVTVFAGKAGEFYPVEQVFSMPLAGGLLAEAPQESIKIASLDLANPVAACGKQAEKQSSLWGIFLLGIAGGLVALLTPCVFPMVPFTVSYFTRNSGNRNVAIRNGLLYGFFIFLIYILLSVPFHIIGNVNPEIFNTISTNAYLNLAFFAVFLYFALSFFGFFEITLPGSLTNKADEKGSLSNIGGIFFMSLTLALVSFSCTGPILGSLLVGSLGGGVWPLTAGLAGFGIGVGLPFGLFAIFPDLLKSLPKSGGWLDTVKKVLAFVELALAFKFLSNADLVMHWGLLKREIFLGIWLIISLVLTAYLFGLVRLPHDTKGEKISVGRKITGIVTLVFALYLLPGVTRLKGMSLDLLSGFPPPLSYSIYEKSDENTHTVEATVVNDYKKAVELSNSQHKPILIDFTGWACVNCRKMEENVWNQPEVSRYIKQNFILVSLYVDDRKKLPIEQRITYTTKDKSKKEIVTQGDKWATFEAENFDQVSQPFYATLNTDQKLLNNPIGYTPDVKTYLDWLKCARTSFDQ